MTARGACWACAGTAPPRASSTVRAASRNGCTPSLCCLVVPARHFVKYTFLKVDPAWRRLDDDVRAIDKREFAAACADFADGHLLRAFSTVGTRGDCDLMLLSQAENLDRIHEFHVVLGQSGLMKWTSIPHSFLAMTKPSEYSDESRLEVRPAHARYLFVYPFVKTRAWYLLSADERHAVMQEHIRVGREYPQIELNTSYSFGLDDQEFVVAFETDDASAFLDLVQRLRTTESSRYTLRDTPVFTCIDASVQRALSALDGVAVSAQLT
ncbi:MAG: chlorite dismutase family protein [Solirubrobacterales bacterium]|nr:chlorite dismutase family protein [Solirubrobacterales bacterium]